MLISSVWRGDSLRWFTLGLVLGGAAISFGLLLVGAIGVQPFTGRVATGVILAVALGVLLAREVGLLRFPLPQNARLVPEEVVNSGPRLGPLQFGFEMGTGLRTYVSASLPYVLVLAVVLMATPASSLVAGLGFGLGRAAMPAVRTWSRDPVDWDQRLLTQESRLRVWTFLIGSLAILLVFLAPHF